MMNKLNNYTYDPDTVLMVRNYIESGNMPDLDVKKRYIFKKKWKDFIIKDNDLVFGPTGQIVVTTDKINDLLLELYQDLNFAGIGIEKMYHKICDMYIGIHYDDVKNFLTQQEPYQLTKQIIHKINKPILATYPNERWAIDLIDMNPYVGSNNQRRYILTCIDYFSKYCWAKGITQKTAVKVTEAFKLIVEEAGIKPKIVQKDNGGEFQGEFNTYLKDEGIKLINTLSYSPQSNGLVENLNKNLRKIIREVMARHNNHKWFIYLSDITHNKNTQRNKVTKHMPIEIWTPTHDTNHNEFTKDIHTRLINRAKKVLDKEKTVLQIGDMVRVSQTQIKSDIRKKIKDGDKKNIIISFSPEVFKIRSIIMPDRNTNVENRRYTLETLDGEPFLTEVKINNPNAERSYKRVFGSELQKVNDDVAHLTQKDADKLNQVQHNYVYAPEPVINNPIVEPVNNNPVVEPVNNNPVINNPVIHPVVYPAVNQRPVRNRQRPNHLNDYV